MDKELGKMIWAVVAMVTFLGCFFFVSNEQFKEELKVSTGTAKYDASAQLEAAGIEMPSQINQINKGVE